PALSDAATTTDRTLVPTTPQKTYDQGPNPALPDALADYLKRGFGETAIGGAQAYVTRVIEGGVAPPPGPGAKRILRFATLADLQLADDESPNRLGLFDSAGPTNGALRPQDAYLCRMTNAAVRTIDALHRKDPIAFTLLGGDNADSAQKN